MTTATPSVPAAGAMAATAASTATTAPPVAAAATAAGCTAAEATAATPLPLDQALAVAEAAATVREAAALLRARLAPLKVVVVDAMDMRGEAPYAQGARRSLYLGATDGHCWQMTTDPARAAGLFICDR